MRGLLGGFLVFAALPALAQSPTPGAPLPIYADGPHFVAAAIVVADERALLNTAISWSPVAWRLGVEVPGDSVAVLFVGVPHTACSDPDINMQVPSADGGCWTSLNNSVPRWNFYTPHP